MGDSKSIVDWANNVHHLHTVELSHWLRRVKDLIGLFQQISFGHIYREFNVQADTLSKQGLTVCLGKIFWKQFIKYYVVDDGVFQVH